MGQTLTEPIINKHTASCANSCYKVGSSSMQGWRTSMEDAHAHILSLPGDENAAFFAVYDGHGGSKISQYASIHLHNKIVRYPTYATGNIEDAIKWGFLGLDEQMLEEEETKERISGTTAVTVLIKNSTIYCGNVGDSRAVASINGKVHPLSYDHKPKNKEESDRITAAGGFIESDRINGNLALSRALGDFIFKRNEGMSVEKQIVTADPEIIKLDISQELEFIILACDGIWDVLSNEEAIQFCRELLSKGNEPEKVCEKLIDRCLAPDCELSGIGCDNMTVIIVVPLQNKSWEEYVEILEHLVETTGDGKDKKLETITDFSAEEQFLTPNQSPNAAIQTSNENSINADEVPSHNEEKKNENEPKVEIQNTS